MKGDASVTERRVSTTNPDAATPNFAELPCTQLLYDRTVPVTTQFYQQAYPTKS